MSEFVDQLRKFVVDNNIVGTSAGVCIALATKDGIQSLVGDIIIPGIVILLHSLHIDSLTKILPIHGKAQLNIMDFLKQFITWILIIVISFIFVKVAFEYLLGISNNKNGTSAVKIDDKKNEDNGDGNGGKFQENFFTSY